MANNTHSSTMLFTSEDIKRENLKQLLSNVSEALTERGYNPVNQISGYLISNDPAYISSHKDARSNIQQVERYEIIEELVRFYLESK
ncbi:MAG: IreB family regulatory phosphoprotein [Erysipelotrichaceae bacterium]|nr:IreB family regulatory phosphoprotein [Erysipelotrichaceae bacterium]